MLIGMEYEEMDLRKVNEILLIRYYVIRGTVREIEPVEKDIEKCIAGYLFKSAA